MSFVRFSVIGLLLGVCSLLVPNASASYPFDSANTNMTAAVFAKKFAPLIPDDGKLVSIKVYVKGQPLSDDPILKAREIRFLQTWPLKFVFWADGLNTISDKSENFFTTQVHPKVAEFLEERSDVISVTILDDVSSSQSISCKSGLVQITKYNDNLACVKPTSVYPLLQRGWISIENTDLNEIAIEVATLFIKNGPTFRFDGIEDSLSVDILSVRESFPEQFEIEAKFSSLHAGYGDRQDQILAQAITPHTTKLLIISGEVVSGIIDEQWDELHQISCSPTPC